MTKASPGQLLVFAADRFTGEPQRRLRRAGARRPAAASASGRPRPTACSTLALPEDKADRYRRRRPLRRPGGRDRSRALVLPASRRASWSATSTPTSRSIGPGHTVHVKAVLRWRERDALLRSIARRGDRGHRHQRQGRRSAPARTRRRVRRRRRRRSARRRHAALGFYSIRVASGDAAGQRRLRGAGVPPARVRGDRHRRRAASSCRATRPSPTCRPATTSASRSPTRSVRYVVNQQAYYSPLRWDDGADGDEEERLLVRRRPARRGRPAARRAGPRRDPRAARGRRNGRDYSARIEAQVTDASSREVSGNTVVHATYGPFLVAAQPRPATCSRPEPPCRWLLAPWTTPAPRRPMCRCASLLERLTYPDGYYNAPTVTEVSEAAAAHRCRRAAHRRRCAFPTRRAVPRGAWRRREGQRDLRDDAWLWVPGPSSTAAERRRPVPRTAGRQAHLRARRHGAHRRPRRDVVGPVLRDQGRPARDVAPGGAAHRRRRVRGADRPRRRRRHLRQRRCSCATAGSAGRAAAGRAAGPRDAADHADGRPADGQAAGAGVLRRAGHRRRRRAGAGQVSLGGDRRGGVRRQADDTPDPVRVFYRREYTRVEHGVLARLLLHRLLRRAIGCSWPSRRRRPLYAGRLQGRQAGPAAGAEGVPRRHLLDGDPGHRRRRPGEVSPCAIPMH